VSFAAITLCVAPQRVFVVVVVAVYFVIDSVRRLLDTPSYTGDSRSSGQEIASRIGIRRFVTVFTSFSSE
jgi:hypothetical protein